MLVLRFNQTVQEGNENIFAIPCEIENDVNCAGLAEAVSGSE